MSKLYQSVKDEILTLTSQGHKKNTVCKAVGISVPTLNNWLLASQNGNPDFKDFYRNFEKATVQVKIKAHDILINTHFKRDHRAIITFLERTDPDYVLRTETATQLTLLAIQLKNLIITGQITVAQVEEEFPTLPIQIIRELEEVAVKNKPVVIEQSDNDTDDIKQLELFQQTIDSEISQNQESHFTEYAKNHTSSDIPITLENILANV